METEKKSWYDSNVKQLFMYGISTWHTLFTELFSKRCQDAEIRLSVYVIATDEGKQLSLIVLFALHALLFLLYIDNETSKISDKSFNKLELRNKNGNIYKWIYIKLFETSFCIK